eukprot:CAMPEP_0183450838 /NCGR_PEP_ID=MMETSP0370-20130417/113555_1 /TAXON_ID=268820 /ORGANISM="Peridinium aciculiferum, Strain PAER-2" /LENGTH=68 /DNA_ID=CAMNT_0025642007 /DNA_START=14 /DNA_END=217 /DNA_ORIENTATION=-
MAASGSWATTNHPAAPPLAMTPHAAALGGSSVAASGSWTLSLQPLPAPAPLATAPPAKAGGAAWGSSS